MPSLLHEGLIDLFRHRPSLAAELLRDTLHAPLAPFDVVRVGEGNLTKPVPSELRADLVLLLERQKKREGALIVEVQLDVKPNKRVVWPSYVVGLRARLRCNVALLVVTDDPRVARWAAKPIEIGHPGFVLTPLVLGPGLVPIVTDEVAAARSPELAVLSSIVYGKRPEAAEIGRAALAGARGLDDERAALYTDLVLAFVNDAARGVLEALMASGTYQYQSDFARRYVAQGEAAGEARGEAKGLRAAVMRVLAARGLALSDGGRARVASCEDVSTLTAWLERAVTAASEAEVFAGSNGT